MLKKDIKSWLAKQALWQVHIPRPKEIHHPHYDDTKPNQQHQFDLLYMPHNPSSIDVASRYRVARPLRTKKPSEFAFMLEAICKKGCVFKYPKTFQCDNGSEFNPFQDGFFRSCSDLPHISYNDETWQLYLTQRRSTKYTNQLTHHLSSADISIFSPEISKFCYIKKYRYRLYFDK